MSDLTPSGIPPVPEETPYAPPAGQIIPPPPVGSDLALTANDKTMGMLCHLLALSGFIGIPFGNILGPLIIWLTQKDKSAFADYHGKESLNFQITLIIAAMISGVLCLLLIGFVLLLAVWIYGIVMTIIATIKANEGIYYRYPYTLRLIK
jgi:uncharacterized protein